MPREPQNPAGSGMDPEKTRAVREALLAWFASNARDLPWRRTRDPWRVLVSEVMLQQIQVKRAIPFYERFLTRFPTVKALADAPLSDAIRVWGDLGRYRRVVNLHRTARLVVDEHGGRVPDDPEVLVTLPGVGPYTAGAVACFAFERDVAFADTNMLRALHRVFVGPDVPAPAARPKEVLDLAAGLVPAGGGWVWNQAVMEFGALRCTARKPGCEGCPLAEHCRARTGIRGILAQTSRPARKPSAPRYEETNRYLRGRVLAQLRGEEPSSSLALPELARRLRGETAGVEPAGLRAAVESLERDGLVRVSLPDGKAGGLAAEAVAEERASYAAGSEEGDLSGIRVALP